MELEKNHLLLGNLVWIYNTQEVYVDEDDPWMVILAAAAFTNFSTKKILKVYTLGPIGVWP